MNELLAKNVENRQAIIEAIEQEIVGPSNQKNLKVDFANYRGQVFTSFDDFTKNFYWLQAGQKEEILRDTTPSRRYAAGMIYPAAYFTDSEEEIETLELRDFETDTKEVIVAEDDPIIEEEGDSNIQERPITKETDPATLGISFCVSNRTKKLKFKFTGGIYHTEKIQRKIKHAIEGKATKLYEGSVDWWFRKSIISTYKLDIEAALNTSKPIRHTLTLQTLDGQKIEHIQCELMVQIRQKDNYLLITATVINTTKPKTRIQRDKIAVFQSCLHVINPDEAFLHYPKLAHRHLSLTEEEWNNELLYKQKKNYAFGHNCSTYWDQHNDYVQEIKTTFIPTYETETMSPNIEVVVDGMKKPIKITMASLKNIKTYEEATTLLQPLIDGYEMWLQQQQELLQQEKQPSLIAAGEKNIGKCRESLERMKKGLNLLKDRKVLQAFCLANEAILYQQLHGTVLRETSVKDDRLVFSKSYEAVIKSEKQLNEADNAWRGFQIAFFLMSIQSLVEKESIEREIVDLIWFPTGGGKTEAYLGVAAFQMFYRRLLNKEDVGVDILMRYTLRLLTADQFQRASRLICAMEVIRRNYEDTLGATPYSIGIWVGQATTPNTYKDSNNLLNEMMRGKGPDNIVLTKCPWCGCKLGRISAKQKTVILGYKGGQQFITHCPDKKCVFSEEIPVYFIDEAVYKKRPTFLIGTVDKFVQLTWKSEAKALFGIDKNGKRNVSPPQLILQDELHLISGPLGTLSGLYETLIEELCLDDRGPIVIKPKIISATATIKGYEEQIKCLFGRDQKAGQCLSALFPHPSITIEDSYFSKVAMGEDGKPAKGRLYVGIFTSKVRILMAQVMVYGAILQKVQQLDEDYKDPFWTLLSFYNSLKDLGAGLNLFQSDIPTYIDAIYKRENYEKRRYLGNPLELTSRKQSSEITKIIDDLNMPYDKEDAYKALSVCLASNIIEVGVDIARLSLMGIIGQPKTTAQYIQVSGRVGRIPNERPGLITTIYSNTNSRDKSHFEHFNEYHQRLYAAVETSSVTPFSTAAIQRGLPAVLIGFLRQRLDVKEPTYENIVEAIEHPTFKTFKNRLYERVKLIDPLQIHAFDMAFTELMEKLLNGRFEVWDMKKNEQRRGVMYSLGTPIDAVQQLNAIPVINSLRNVDAESKGAIKTLKVNTSYSSLLSLD